MDDDRTFHYLTAGDILRLGGFLVAPAEIAEALCSAPGVADAQVVAVGLETGRGHGIRDSGRVPPSVKTRSSSIAAVDLPLQSAKVVSSMNFHHCGPNGVKIRLTDARLGDRTVEPTDVALAMKMSNRKLSSRNH